MASKKNTGCPETNGKDIIIIGIDFGTTYSGVAYTWSNKADRLEVITSWDSDLHANSDLEKAPTTLAFESKPTNVTWGYSIPQDSEQAKWFKLLLVDSNDLPESVQNSDRVKQAGAYLRKHNKTALEVIGLYLRHLWNHATQRITETVGRATVNSSKFDVLITLPAIWPVYAQHRMRDAAKIAGILGPWDAGPTTLTFLSEPEAAAIATLSDMQDRCDIKASRAGDSFVVVDCGGGTVDLIGYEMVGLAPPTVKECVKGQGDLCGAIFVDDAFTKLLKHKLGPWQWGRLTDESRRRIQHDEWEHGIKSQFDGSWKEWRINIPWECLSPGDLIAAQLSIPKLVLTSTDIQLVFDPVVDKIHFMVQSQIAAVLEKKGKAPKYVILVGGFGLLQSRGANPWTAICRGAVIHGASSKRLSCFAVDVQARVSRASYGIVRDVPWNAEIHDPAHKIFKEAVQDWRAKDQVRWFLKVGDLVTPHKRFMRSLRKYYKTDDSQEQIITTRIYHSSCVSPPKAKNDHVTTLCRIVWDSKIDVTSLPTYINSLGKVFYVLHYTVEMTVEGGILDFAVYHKGKRQGGKSVVVDFEIA
ncbi:hypothetical protein QBC40DRAFT_307057 [Triangularia verruculosa]|uniref:Actin-like ATPase domain-containing protein n=1 Tax=Triangularia verruculosa TaxID=2587418 RepID=A0AAN6XG15_9PEZI|nr:hypothetical protein QBC40DRAFT_307057 [Triangularia verruculosa]